MRSVTSLVCRPQRHFAPVALHNRALRIIRKGGKDVQQETRHRVAFVGVDVLSYGEKPYAQCNQFLNAFDQMRNGFGPTGQASKSASHRSAACRQGGAIETNGPEIPKLVIPSC